MQKPLIINIPKPCDEDWAQMTQDGQGRYCSHCQKTVIDFTKWNNADLYRFLKDRKEPLCGRVKHSQLNVPILPPAKQTTHLYRMVVALGLTLVFTSTANVIAHPRAPYAFAPFGKHKHKKKTGSNARSVTGNVHYRSGWVTSPVKGANVRLMNGSELLYNCITDSHGTYSIPDITPGTYSLRIESPGFESYVRYGVKLPSQIVQHDTLAVLMPAVENYVEDTSIQQGTMLSPENWDTFYFAPIPLDSAADNGKIIDKKKGLKEKGKKDIKPKRK